MVQAFQQTDRDSPVVRRYGGRCPCCADAAGSTGDGPDSAEKLFGSSADALMCESDHGWEDLGCWHFSFPVYRYRGRGPCPQGHGPHDKVHLLTVMESHGR